MQADALFRLENVTLRPARLRGVSLEIPRGITAVLGASGSGKTSLLNVLAGFEKPNSGTLHGDTRVAWAPQGDGLWPGCTARAHLTECGATIEKADALLGAFDLANLADAKPPGLSRGEQGRLALARALAMTPCTLVLDEPLAHVDPARIRRFWGIVREHVRASGASLIFATHSPDFAMGAAEHAICLSEGSVVFSGSVVDLYERPASEELANFLGPANWITPDDARMWFGKTWPGPRCVRPERLSIVPCADGLASVHASRFCGAFAETELRASDGALRAFLHRPPAALEHGTRVMIHLPAEAPR